MAARQVQYLFSVLVEASHLIEASHPSEATSLTLCARVLGSMMTQDGLDSEGCGQDKAARDTRGASVREGRRQAGTAAPCVSCAPFHVVIRCLIEYRRLIVRRCQVCAPRVVLHKKEEESRLCAAGKSASVR